MQLEDCLNLLLSRAQYSFLQVFRKELEPLNITPTQYGVLSYLQNNNGASSSKIAEFLGVENSSMTGVIDRMEQKELVRREAGIKDRRMLHVFMTEKGEGLLPELMEIMERINKLFEQNFEQGEVEQLRALLTKMVAPLNIGEI